ncbi:uncharacterized protein LOC110233162 [Exaiptasia diaphana]|uniref:Uncharacterized protein n=1 Tax=Exaiptasia diaphana TaxID=2652724 RepID=A0A913YDN1_EXADI|nr:uncharacterized protein LOC110233162 [Exaiptasia diaphana]
MSLQTDVTLYLVVGLLVCQLIILALLILFCKKYKRLKKTVENYIATDDLERQRRSTDAKEHAKNEYIPNKRDTSTLVRTNSKESIVFVPSPLPNRRSRLEEEGLDVTTTTVVHNEENFGFVNDHFESSPINEVHVGNEIPTIHIEEEQDRQVTDQEEIYENQEFVAMAMDGENQNYRLQVVNDPTFEQSGASSVDEPIYVNREMIELQMHTN